MPREADRISPSGNAQRPVIVDDGSTTCRQPKDQEAREQQGPPIILNNGVEMPQLGFGVSAGAGRRGRAGRRHGAGGRAPQHRHRCDLRQRRGHRQGHRRLRLPREDIFVTTEPGTATRARLHAGAFDASLEKLGLRLRRPVPDPLAAAVPDTYVDTYKALEKRVSRRPRPRHRQSPTSCPSTCAPVARGDSVVPAVTRSGAAPRAPAAARGRECPRRAGASPPGGLVAARPGQGPPRVAITRGSREARAHPGPGWCGCWRSSSATSRSRSPVTAGRNIEVFDSSGHEDRRRSARLTRTGGRARTPPSYLRPGLTPARP